MHHFCWEIQIGAVTAPSIASKSFSHQQNTQRRVCADNLVSLNSWPAYIPLLSKADTFLPERPLGWGRHQNWRKTSEQHRGPSPLRYLSGQRHFYGDRNQLCQQTPVERDHEHHRVTVREHQRHLQQHKERPWILLGKDSVISTFRTSDQIKFRHFRSSYGFSNLVQKIQFGGQFLPLKFPQPYNFQ